MHDSTQRSPYDRLGRDPIPTSTIRRQVASIGTPHPPATDPPADLPRLDTVFVFDRFHPHILRVSLQARSSPEASETYRFDFGICPAR